MCLKNCSFSSRLKESLLTITVNFTSIATIYQFADLLNDLDIDFDSDFDFKIDVNFNFNFDFASTLNFKFNAGLVSSGI